jgi:hypothetical protein
VFKQDELCTDTDAVFLDIEKDGDLDLIVSSGGYEYLPNDLMLQNRVYINDGKGNFSKSFDALVDTPYADSSIETIDLTMSYLSSNGYTSNIYTNPYISSVTNGSAVISHPANSIAGKTFDYVVVG